MKGKTNKINNFDQFFMENNLLNKEKDTEKQAKINKLERELFYDIINNLIDSNNVDKMNDYITYMKDKLWLSINQFIHHAIYNLKDKDIKVNDISIDYNDLDERINLFKKRVDDL